mmetsp:Transcript_10258/g.9060  ORF Transcript_10258/g.9060 Transcript_10258/m.9060 type:complete len:171 (-) Transcript_10258:146-658(-)
MKVCQSCVLQGNPCHSQASGQVAAALCSHWDTLLCILKKKCPCPLSNGSKETLKHHCLYCAVAPTALHLVGGHGLDDIGVTSVGDGHHGHAEVATAGRAQLDVVAAVVVHAGLGQHSVVLQLGLPHRRNVVGHNQELGLARAQGLQGSLEAQLVLAGLHDQGQTAVDVLG